MKQKIMLVGYQANGKGHLICILQPLSLQKLGWPVKWICDGGMIYGWNVLARRTIPS